jgi:hypothetical protein
MLDGAIRLRSKPELSALSPNDVDNARLVRTPTLALEKVTVDSGLEAMLEVGKSIELEIEQSLTVSVSYGAGEEKAGEALLITRMRAIRTEESERRQLVDF